MGAGPAHAAHFGMYEFVREISGGRNDGWQGVAGTGESTSLMWSRWVIDGSIGGCGGSYLVRRSHESLRW